jgi:uncharacterized protein YqjF (DUF2071 family)
MPVDELRPIVPPQLSIDTFEGDAWIGVTPFRVRSLRLRWTPPVPVLSSFGEINVRTYVTAGDGRPGIYFFSLDANSRLGVAAARRTYRLPYFGADITVRGTAEDEVRYRSKRQLEPSVGFAAEYRPRGDVYHAAPGSLDHFLTERYCLYTLDDERDLHRGEIHHPPWPLQKATATIETNTMVKPLGLRLSGDPLVHFAGRQDVLIWPLSPVERD